MRFSKVWLCGFILHIPFLLAGQSNPSDSYTFNLKSHYSFVMMHSKNMAHLANQRPWGIEADVYRTTDGSKEWQIAHNYPVIGYAFLYYHMDKDKPLGDSYSLVIYYGKQYLRSKRGSLGLQIGMGPAYIERRFDKQTNYKNNLISNRINFTLYGRLNYTFWITSNWNVNGGIGLTHHSNGATKVPNLGVNYPCIYLGVGYRPGIPQRKEGTSLSEFRKETQLHLSLAAGGKEIYPVEGPMYFISNFSAYVNRKVNRKSGLNVGMDVMFDGSNKRTIDSVGGNHKKIEYFKWAATIGHEFFIDKVSLLTQIGVYLYDPLRKDKRFYERVGLKYYVTKDVYGIMALKVHLGSADYVEWGAGVKF